MPAPYRFQVPPSRVARRQGVHEEAVRRWVRERELPSVTLGNRGGFRFKREDLDRFLERRRTAGPPLT